MATGLIKTFGAIETGNIATESYGTLSYAYNPMLKIAWLGWNGNGTAPTAGAKTFTVPSKLAAKKALTSSMHNGSFLQINGTSVTVSLTSTVWSAGCICYPTV